MSQVKKSLPLKLGASLIGGATLIVCVGALALPARAAVSSCDEENRLSECVPDSTLRGAIINSLTTAGITANESTQLGNLGDTNDLSINAAYTSGEKIHDLSGLRAFSRIKSLNLKGNDVRDVSELAGLNRLQTLDLSGNPIITGLSKIGQKTQLETLSLDSDGANRLSDISALSNFPNLTTLSLVDQKIADVGPLSGLTKLKTLNLSKNEIKDVSPLKSLDNLTYLNVSDNHIKDILPVAGIVGLQEDSHGGDKLVATRQTITLTPRHQYNKDEDWVVDGIKLSSDGDVYATPSNFEPRDSNYRLGKFNRTITWVAPAKYRSVGFTFEGTVTTHTGKNLGVFSGSVTQYATVVNRLSGNVRYDTMGAIVEEAYPTSGDLGESKTVIVASGDNFPDALAASGLSGKLNAPIVLTNSYQLSARADGQLARLQPKRVIVVGGPSAVSDGVVDQITKRVTAPTEADVVRISGATRRDTANEIFAQAEKQHAKGQPDKDWNANTAVIATGENFVDALSISSLAKQKSYPVFLSGKDGLDASTVKAIKDYGFANVIIAGGSQAVPQSVVGQLKTAGVDGQNIHRIGGATRYQTSLQIAQYQRQFDSASLKSPVFATGENFPDALAGGVLAGKKSNPILLVSPDTSVNTDALNWIKSASKGDTLTGFNADTDFAYVLGGVDAVSEAVADEISTILGD